MRTARRVGFALAALCVPALIASAATGGQARAAHLPATARILRLGPGHVQAKAQVPEPDGVILLAQISTLRRVHVSVHLTDSNVAGPGVADITFANSPSKRDPSLSCAMKGDTKVCDQAEEWCPMPAATWQLRVTKHGGPAAQVRIDFTVGPEPQSTS
jgi:hypothetical protein